jgi:DegV family protein with EDD domain
VSRVAIVTDSAADLPPEAAARAGITVVPLVVSFGTQSYRAGVDLPTDEFWRRMLEPGAPFPTTAAASPGDFKSTFEGIFATGVEAIVCVTVGGKLSATVKSATIARDMLPDREIHVIDSNSASMGVGLVAQVAAELASAGVSGSEIARIVEARTADLDLYLAMDTLEYLRKGGRISGARAAIGTVLSFKPIITVRDGLVEVFERVRTRSKARDRVVELLTRRPVERIAFLHTMTTAAELAEVDRFRDMVVARMPGGVDAAHVSVQAVGSSVGPHLGPGCLGAVLLHHSAPA